MSNITANNLIQDLISYGNYYNEQRAIPSIYDGLKPSQRKILYAAYLIKAFSTKAHVKFSKLSGTVTEFYHHGDNALDGTIIRMAQGFKMGNPLIDIEGNRGSQARLHKSNAGASAPRYLMVKTTALADKLMESIKTDTAIFSPYEEDPQYLWIGLPAFLLFRQKGIGTGTATNVPSFTLESVEKLTEELIKLNGDISAEQIANILVPYAEQQPILVNKSDMPNIFAQNGKSKSMRFRAKIEDRNGKLVATNFPIGVSPFMVVENIKKNLANVPIFNNITKVQEISGIGSNNTALTGLELYYKKGTNTKELINFLFVKTSLESSDAVTLTLVNSKGKAAELSYPEALKEWFEIAVSKSYHIIDIKLSTIESKLTRQKALYIGAINALEIVELIQSSTDRQDAENKLVEKYNITEEYAKIILGLKLHQLTKLETSAIEAEMLRLEELMLYWIGIRDDESSFKKFMISESKIGIKGNGGVHMEDSKIVVPKFAVNEDFYYRVQNQKNGLKTIKTSDTYVRGWNKASKNNPIHYMQDNRVIRLEKVEPDITDVIDVLDTEYFYVINTTTGMVKGNTSDKLHTTKDRSICGFDVDLLVKSNTTANAYIVVETNMGNAQIPLDTIRLTNFSDKAVGVKLIKLRDGEKIEKAYFSNTGMGAAYTTGRAVSTKKRK